MCKTEYSEIRPIILESLRRYADHHLETGGFLKALLSNDLTETVGRADEGNIKVLDKIIMYCYNEIPSECWGTPKRVEAWLKLREKKEQ